MDFVLSMILLPMHHKRKAQFSIIDEALTIIKHYQTSQASNIYKINQTFLKDFVDPETNRLNMKRYKPYILGYLKKEPFFNRFSVELLEEFLENGTPELYQRDNIIFLKQRVGVVTKGSIRLYQHTFASVEPLNLGKFEKGKVIGHHSDNGVS